MLQPPERANSTRRSWLRLDERRGSQHFDRYFVAVPPENLRTIFDDSVGEMFKQVANLDNQNRKLAQARDLLLPRLVNGEVAV